MHIISCRQANIFSSFFAAGNVQNSRKLLALTQQTHTV